MQPGGFRPLLENDRATVRLLLLLNDVDIGQWWIHRLNDKAGLGDGITPANPIAPAPVRLCDPGGVEKPLLAERYASILLRRPANLGENYFACHPIFVHGSTS
jgi:hypothetical protein